MKKFKLKEVRAGPEGQQKTVVFSELLHQWLFEPIKTQKVLVSLTHSQHVPREQRISNI